MKKFSKWAVAVLAVIALLSLLVGAFDWAAKPVATVLNKPVEGVKSVARMVAALAIGCILVLAGLTTIAGAPVIGVILLGVGVLTVITTLWPVLSPNE